jgi:hypothetical protein
MNKFSFVLGRNMIVFCAFSLFFYILYGCGFVRFKGCKNYESCVSRWSYDYLIEPDTVIVEFFITGGGIYKWYKNPNFAIVNGRNNKRFGILDTNLDIANIKPKSIIVINKISEEYLFSTAPRGVETKRHCDLYCSIDKVYFCSIDTTSIK